MMLPHKQTGFTVIELIVSVTIFAFMTAFLVAKYGNFNQSVLLTNFAYDVALTIRNAQTYGLNVKSKPTAGSNYTDGSDYATIEEGYKYAYGIHFDTSSVVNPPDPAPRTRMIFFSDVSKDKAYTLSEAITSYAMRNGSYISGICVGTTDADCQSGGSGVHPSTVDITFLRPDPDAMIVSGGVTYKYAEITVGIGGGAAALSKRIAIRSTGQITVLHN